MLVDFGISQRLPSGPPKTYDPLVESKCIVGTLNWASLNAHNGLDLAPRDDLESLAYIALFLLSGELPWMSHKLRNEPIKRSMQRIRQSKESLSSATLPSDIPPEFGALLDHARGLAFDEMPDYQKLDTQFDRLAQRVGCMASESLHWALDAAEAPKEPESSSLINFESDDEGDKECDDEEQFSNSYFAWDIGDWDIQIARDRDLTLPFEQEDLADSLVPEIIRVIDNE